MSTDEVTILDGFICRPYRSSDYEAVVSQARAYSLEVRKEEVNESVIRAKISRFDKSPEQGRIDVIEHKGQIVAYTVLVPILISEFGGTILMMNEGYVAPEFRVHFLGLHYFMHLTKYPPYSAVAIQVEAGDLNPRARTLCERLGFQSYLNGLIYTL